MDPLSTQRPRSVRSVASNSSIGSGTSLCRRPRITRSRSRTVTGRTTPPTDIPEVPSTPSALAYLSGSNEQDTQEEHVTPSNHTLMRQTTVTSPLDCPSSLPQKQEIVDLTIRDTSLTSAVKDPGATFLVKVPSEMDSNQGNLPNAIPQPANLPRLNTGYKPPPSAFSRDPALTPIVNVRDSISTEQSGLSSSIYPPSTLTASAINSPASLASISGYLDVTLPQSDVKEAPARDDENDISNRVQLLVKNSYFLPPAHFKPPPIQLAPNDMNMDKKSPRVTTPAFLDLFRVGKSKSKPTTPTGGVSPGFDTMAPMLRATSDSITAPFVLRSNEQPSTEKPLRRIASQAPPGRVVVVREEVADMIAAAKQSEKEIKAHPTAGENGVKKVDPIAEDEYIDPTDAVDLPLPPPSYPFAVQASALRGLGVLESLGADVLADRLIPPKQSDTSFPADASEDSWRKALLAQAVSHSLDNTPDVSTFSYQITLPTPSKSTPGSNSVANDAQTNTNDAKTPTQTQFKDQVGNDSATAPTRKILLKYREVDSVQQVQAPIIADNDIQESEPSHFFQIPETPLGPLTPLNPPPRRRTNIKHSVSQEDLCKATPDSNAVPDSQSVAGSSSSRRRAISSPNLEDEHGPSRQYALSPPPMPADLRYSHATDSSLEASHDDAGAGDAHVNDTDEHRRASLTLSAVAGRQTSLSEYSQPSASPTTSTFQEALNHQRRSHSSADRNPAGISIEQREAYLADSRSTASPLPRAPSALAEIAFSPPPRSSSLNYSKPLSGHSAHTRTLSQGSTFHIPAPEPTTPPLPIPEQGNLSRTLDSLDASPTPLPLRIPSSAPGPSSPTSFFDSIQSQPNAMDDLDSSSDESEDEPIIPLPPKVLSDTLSRASSASASSPTSRIMRLGNLSSPHFKTGESISHHDTVPLGHDSQSKKPISNIPVKPAKDLPPSSYDFFAYAQENLPNFPSPGAGRPGAVQRRPVTADNVTTLRDDQKQESLRKLDGMLLRHIEDEKDTIKRIATHLKQTADSQKTPFR
ncbi:hypothetical protein CPC08DRAFT_704762 [Agrocybe pediades]|nr:hypothetical protein CPC08DRAFT_704762 [Agrocybe pediades]